MKQKPIAFGNLAESLSYVGSRIKNPLEEYVARSNMLKQRRLFDFF